MKENNTRSIQEIEQMKIELEMKQNYYGAFMTNVLSNEHKEHMENLSNCQATKCS